MSLYEYLFTNVALNKTFYVKKIRRGCNTMVINNLIINLMTFN